MLEIRKPVIIVGCPRSGTSLLFRILSTSSELWSLYRESNEIWDLYFQLTKKELQDDILSENDLNNKSKNFILNEFHKKSLNNYYLGYFNREFILKNNFFRGLSKLIIPSNLLYKNLLLRKYRLVEKTPKNCYRIPFVNKLFKDCLFIFLKRDGRSNISSLIEGWKIPNKYLRTENLQVSLNIKGYNDTVWKFVLPPGWKNYTNKPLEEVCAFQWISSNKAALEGLQAIENQRKYFISYEELSCNTYEIVKKVCDFIDIPFTKRLRDLSKTPPIVNANSKPDKDKWKKNIDLIKNTYPVIEPMMKELGYRIDYC
ncbi:MAG: sulfotransferase [Candidatus Melainabacteria bacterium]|nr:sulfotransferase [Candidatus Melainabacteria bacterium]